MKERPIPLKPREDAMTPEQTRMFLVASEHSYECTCNCCKEWWALMPPEDEDEEEMEPIEATPEFVDDADLEVFEKYACSGVSFPND